MKKINICDFTQLMGFLSKKWVLMIIKSISDGCKSYSEIEKNLTGINPRILSNRLTELQDIGFVEKKILSKKPLRCMYCLTEKGLGLSEHINKLSEWIQKSFDCTTEK